MKNKIQWIDNVKGLGIICVVIGHITSFLNSFIYLFHIPLFFFVSGYLFKFKPNKKYLIDKSKHLLIPYFIYLILILTPQMILYKQPLYKSIIRFLLGGRFLYTWTGPLWFITCLFLTQQIFNLLQKFSEKKIAFTMAIFLCLSYINSFFWNKNIPWNINVCLFSCPIFYVGFIMKNFINNKNFNFLFPLFIILFSIILCHNYPRIKLDMKNSNYGIPLFSFGLSILITISLIFLLKTWNFFNFLGYFGKSSMIIMYLHQPIHYIFLDYLHINNQWFIVVLAILIPLMLYNIFNKNNITKKYLLGE